MENTQRKVDLAGRLIGRVVTITGTMNRETRGVLSRSGGYWHIHDWSWDDTIIKHVDVIKQTITLK